MEVEEEKASTNALEDESYEMEMEPEPVADKMKVKEPKKKKKSAKDTKVLTERQLVLRKTAATLFQQEEFFEDSPAFNPDQVFSEMKISRPLLKVSRSSSSVEIHSDGESLFRSAGVVSDGFAYTHSHSSSHDPDRSVGSRYLCFGCDWIG